MAKTYSCEACKKVFEKKTDFSKHKKVPCVVVEPGTKASLINIFKNCLNILRDNEGLTGEKALKNMSYLLILKLIEPRLGNELDIDGYEYDFSAYDATEEAKEKHKSELLRIARFSNLAKEPEDNLFQKLKDLWEDILSVHPATKHIFLKGKSLDIRHQSTYKKLIEKLNSPAFEKNEYDILGNAYEEVIQDIMTGKVLGQFFTQPLVKKLMVRLIDPKIHPDGRIDTCGDPTMGTGGFLITYLQYILAQAKAKGIAPDWSFIKTEGLYGKELDPDTYQLAVSNMLISSGHMFEHLERGDSIRSPITRKFDNILANPPFGIKGLKYDDFRSPLKEQYVPIKSDNAVSLFIQAIIYMLKVDGKCAIVLPDGQDLFSKTNATLAAVREYLMKTCDLKEIIYLPSGIFTYTSIKTCIFYFVKKREGADMLKVKITRSKATQKERGREYTFDKSHQTTVVKFYDCNLLGDGAKNLIVEVPIEKIAKNSYSLNYAEYMEVAEEKYADGVVVKTLGEVCEISIGGTPSRSKIEYYKNGNNLWVSVKELNGGYIYDTCEKINDLGVCNSNVKLLAKDTVLFSFKLSIGKTAIVGNPLYTNEAIAGLKSKDSNLLSNKYLYHYLTNRDFSKLGSGLIGSGSMNKKMLEQIKIPIPPMEKQMAIVEYLDIIYKANKTSYDKIAESESLNGWCMRMQELLGRDVKKTLGEVCVSKNGKGIKRESFTKGEYPVIGGGKQPMGTHGQFNVEENVILCSSSGAYSGFISRYNTKVWASDCFSIIPKDNSLDNDYLYYTLKYMQEAIYKLQSGAAQPHVYSKDLLSVKIPIPSLEKQMAIVEYCKRNTALITALKKEIRRNEKQARLFLDYTIQGHDDPDLHQE